MLDIFVSMVIKIEKKIVGKIKYMLFYIEYYYILVIKLILSIY